MTTTLPQSRTSVRHRSSKDHLRLGYKGALASASQLLVCCEQTEDRAIHDRAKALLEVVSNELRCAAQLALVHTTIQTLKDGFDATDATLVMCAQLARRAIVLKKVGLQVRVAVLLAGVRAGISELELGLESVPMLPVSAPEYPEEA